jgi:hypothetical protein
MRFGEEGLGQPATLSTAPFPKAKVIVPHFFSFFARLFFAFLAARILTLLVGWEGRPALVGLTLLFLANIYLFDYLDYRSRTSWRRQASPRPPAPPILPAAAPEPPPEP